MQVKINEIIENELANGDRSPYYARNSTLRKQEGSKIRRTVDSFRSDDRSPTAQTTDDPRFPAKTPVSESSAALEAKVQQELKNMENIEKNPDILNHIRLQSGNTSNATSSNVLRVTSK